MLHLLLLVLLLLLGLLLGLLLLLLGLLLGLLLLLLRVLLRVLLGLLLLLLVRVPSTWARLALLSRWCRWRTRSAGGAPAACCHLPISHREWPTQFRTARLRCGALCSLRLSPCSIIAGGFASRIVSTASFGGRTPQSTPFHVPLPEPAPFPRTPRRN